MPIQILLKICCASFNGLHFQPTFVRWIYSVMEFNNQRQNKHLQYLPYNSYDVSLENLVLNQLIIHKLTFFSSTSLLCLLFIDLVGRKSALVKLRTMTSSQLLTSVKLWSLLYFIGSYLSFSDRGSVHGEWVPASCWLQPQLLHQVRPKLCRASEQTLNGGGHPASDLR